MTLAGVRQGTGPAILFLHGLGLRWQTWEPLFPHLSGFEVHAVDLPGFGASPPLRRPVTIDGLLDAIEEHLDDVGLERPHVVGNSLGGLLAVGLGARGRAQSVTAISPAGMAERWEHHLARWSIRLQKGVADRILPVLRPALANPAVRWIALRAGTAARPHRMTAEQARTIVDGFASSQAIRETLVAMDGPGSRICDHIDKVDVPLTVIWGTRDALLLHRQGLRLKERHPAVALVRLPGVGHVPMYDAPGRIADAMLESSVHRAEISQT